MFNSFELTSKLLHLREIHLSSKDWHQEQLNFVPLRGSWFVQSEHDFDLEAEIDKYLVSDKKVLLLLGDSGAGKSLYTQGLVIKLWKIHVESKPIPIWISLPALKDPVNRLIEETLENYGFMSEQIDDLKRNQQFVFVLDAYDEIRQFKNLYVSNHLDQWQCKIIMTCRREYLYRQDNYKLYFQPFQGEKAQHAAYDEIIIRPFNPNQIQAYIQQYVSNQETIWKEPERYEKAIEEIPGLRNLITTPFMLKLTMEVLPRIIEKHQSEPMIERKRLTQAVLYEVFVEQWFERQEQKLKAAKQIREDEDIKPEFWAYAKALAQAMHERNLTQVVYEEEDTDLYGDVISESPWKRFFDSENSRTSLLQTACLIREVSRNCYAFTHGSLLEYFLTRNLYENILSQSQTSQATMPTLAAQAVAVGSEIVIASPELQIEAIKIIWKEDYFNQRLLVDEPTTLQFLADRIEEQENFKKPLFDRVYASKNNSEMKVAAANAITILNRARVPFSGMDLSEIQIPQANLSGAIFDSTNMKNTDLSNVLLDRAFLRNSDFSGSIMENIQLGELSSLSDRKKGLLPAKSVCFSYDGKYLASGSEDSSVLIWDWQNGKLYRNLRGHNQRGVTAVSFHCSSTKIASAGRDGTAKIWELSTGKLLQTLIGHKGAVENVCFSPDGNYLATGGEDKTVRLYKVGNNLDEVDVLAGSTSRITCLAFHPTKKLLVAGTWYDSLLLWDLNSVKRLEFFKELPQQANSICFSRSGKWMAAGSKDGIIRIWNALTGELACIIKNSDNKIVNSICFNNAESYLFAGSENSAISLWDISGKLLNTLTGHLHNVTSVCISPDDKVLASIGGSDVIRLWDMYTTHASYTLAHADSVNVLKFSSSGRILVSASSDKAIKLWNTKHGKSYKVLNGHSSKVKSVDVSLDEKWLVSAGSSSTLFHSSEMDNILIWNIETNKIVSGLRVNNEINSVCFNSDVTRIAYGDSGGMVRVYKLGLNISFTLEYELFDQNERISCVRFSPNGSYLAAAGSCREIYIWSLENGKLKQKLSGHKASLLSGAVSCLCISVDSSTLATGGVDGTICLWSIKEGKLLTTFKHSGSVTDVCLSNDTALLVASSHRVVFIWNIFDNKLAAVINSLKSLINCVGISKSNQLAIGSSNMFSVWQIILNKDNCCTTLLWRTECSAIYNSCIFDGVKNISVPNKHLLSQRNNCVHISNKTEKHLEESLLRKITNLLIDIGNLNCRCEEYSELKQIHDVVIKLISSGDSIFNTKKYPYLANNLTLCLDELSQKLNESKLYMEAGLSSQFAAEISRRIDASNHSNTIGLLYTSGVAFFAAKNFGRAKVQLKRALGIETSMSENEINANLPAVLSSLGDIAYYEGKFHKAYQYFERSLLLLGAIDDENIIQVISDMKSLGLSLYRCGFYDKAIEKFTDLLHIAKSFYSQDHDQIKSIESDMTAIIEENLAVKNIDLEKDTPLGTDLRLVQDMSHR